MPCWHLFLTLPLSDSEVGLGKKILTWQGRCLGKNCSVNTTFKPTYTVSILLLNNQKYIVPATKYTSINTPGFNVHFPIFMQILNVHVQSGNRYNLTGSVNSIQQVLMYIFKVAQNVH
jgi:hypothetical protein